MLTDIDLGYALNLGLIFWVGDKIMDMYRGFGIDLAHFQGNGGWFLPIPATLEHVVLACLAKKPEDRPQTARQLAQSLDRIGGMAWDEEEAHRWWRQHRPPQVPTPDAMTL